MARRVADETVAVEVPNGNTDKISGEYIIHRMVVIDIADRKMPDTLNKYLLCALNPTLTPETRYT
uniref:Uncharacterized protein n=1 Tax=Romanomermis culicivorax TaxID=13658 RepID=A0A915J0F2_ROMCU